MALICKTYEIMLRHFMASCITVFGALVFSLICNKTSGFDGAKSMLISSNQFLPFFSYHTPLLPK